MKKVKPPPLLAEAHWLAGSYRMLARCLELPMTTVHGWARKRRVPKLGARALQALIAQLRSEGIWEPPYDKPGTYPKKWKPVRWS